MLAPAPFSGTKTVSPACRVVLRTLPDHHSPEPRPTTVPLARTTKNLFLIGERGWASRLLQIPVGMFAGAERDSDWVINLSGDHHKCWPFWDIERIAGADFHIGLGVLPLLNLGGYVDQHAPAGLDLFQFGEQLLPFTLLRGGAGA